MNADSAAEKRLAKLVNLLKLSEGNASEAEAMAAIGKVRELAEKYGLHMDDVRAALESGNAAAGSSTDKAHWRKSDPQFSHTGRGLDMVDRFLSVPISIFTGCKVWRDTDSDGDTVIYFYGHEVDVISATNLRRVIRRALAFEWTCFRDYGLAKGENVANAKLSFGDGMAERLKARMAHLNKASDAATGGTALVVLKGQLTARYFAELGIGLTQGRGGRSYSSNGSAFAAGQAAGNRVDLGRSVTHSGTKAIGRC